ncbi:hypothetical protein [Sorangium sp. So ce341]|uniref:hypothetical protein n=1 Tax=Sorangium sp. So ce341 TaxID=3133302 RepID=UPI003F637211
MNRSIGDATFPLNTGATTRRISASITPGTYFFRVLSRLGRGTCAESATLHVRW